LAPWLPLGPAIAPGAATGKATRAHGAPPACATRQARWPRNSSMAPC